MATFYTHAGLARQGDFTRAGWFATMRFGWRLLDGVLYSESYDAHWRCQATRDAIFGDVVLRMAFPYKRSESYEATRRFGTLALGGVFTRYALHTLGSTSFTSAGIQRRCQAGYDAVGLR